jgi:NADH-quinone oxidoreductase subunit J
MTPDTTLQLTDYLFYFFALLAILSGGVVVFSRNIVHSAFALMFTLFAVAGLYVLLNADFLAVTQILVYVGGILVLILFGVMLTNKIVDVQIKAGSIHVLPASIITAIIAGTLCGVFTLTDWFVVPGANASAVKSTAPHIGEALITTYVLPFEVASVVLLVAMIGAAMIARREHKSGAHS